MKAGDVVTIYEDPLTEKKPEGRAKLIKLLKDDVELQYWRVQFLRGFKGVQGEQYNRWIKKRAEGNG